MRLLKGHRALVTGASRGLCLPLLGQASFITGATLTIDGGKLAGTPPFGAASQS